MMKYLITAFLTFPLLSLASDSPVIASEVSVIYNRNGTFFNFSTMTQHGEPAYIYREDAQGDPLWRMRITAKRWETDRGISIPVAFKIEEYREGWVSLGYPEFRGTTPGFESYLMWDNGETDYYELFVTTHIPPVAFTQADFVACDVGLARPCCSRKCPAGAPGDRLVCCNRLEWECCRCGVCCTPPPPKDLAFLGESALDKILGAVYYDSIMRAWD